MNKEDKNCAIDETEEIDNTIETNHHEKEDLGNNLDEELKQSKKEINELNNKLLRLQADFINFRKRTEKEKESLYSYGIECFVVDLLPILDNFERALNTEMDKEDGFYQGIQMINNQIIGLLNKHSIEELDALGKPFDPNFHHAVAMEESKEYDSNVVIEVLQKGYLFKEKVIRPSMVKVSI